MLKKLLKILATTFLSLLMGAAGFVVIFLVFAFLYSPSIGPLAPDHLGYPGPDIIICLGPVYGCAVDFSMEAFIGGIFVAIAAAYLMFKHPPPAENRTYEVVKGCAMLLVKLILTFILAWFVSFVVDISAVLVGRLFGELASWFFLFFFLAGKMLIILAAIAIVYRLLPRDLWPQSRPPLPHERSTPR